MKNSRPCFVFLALILCFLTVSGFKCEEGPGGGHGSSQPIVFCPPGADCSACQDGQDNDGDGLVDELDPGCTGPKDTSELGTTECDDGVDNDGDGLTDGDDPGCTGPDDLSELGTTECDDGVDNDGGGLTGGGGPGCPEPG